MLLYRFIKFPFLILPFKIMCFNLSFRDHITKLLDNGSAYHCFCTERRLNILRRDAVKLQRVPKYDNRCRHLTPEEVKEKLKSGIPYCIRFKVK